MKGCTSLQYRFKTFSKTAKGKKILYLSGVDTYCNTKKESKQMTRLKQAFGIVYSDKNQCRPTSTSHFIHADP